jgi:hypothetical protein
MISRMNNANAGSALAQLLLCSSSLTIFTIFDFPSGMLFQPTTPEIISTPGPSIPV